MIPDIQAQQGGEQSIGVAMQADGHAEVVLRETPLQGRVVAMVPNGEHVEILQKEAELVKVRWKKIEGWAKSCNVEQVVLSAAGDHATEHMGDASDHLLWEVELDGQWALMEPPFVQMQLTAAFRQGQHSLKFTCKRGEIDFEYEVEFGATTQTNLSIGTRRLVRWTSANAAQDVGRIRAMYHSLDEIVNVLRCGNVVLIKASWLEEQGRRGSVLPRRQD